MGTVLSISPAMKKGAIMDDGVNKTEKSIKRHSMLFSFSWRKLVASSAKKSAKKVTPNPAAPPCDPPPAAANQNQVALLNRENTKKSLQKAPIPVPVPTVPPQTQKSEPASNQLRAPVQNGEERAPVQKQPSSRSLVSPRRVVIQASTGELLRCLGDFMCRRCNKLKELSSGEVILWFRSIDRTLLIQGWQDQGFITPANLVFVYLLCRDAVADDVESASELQGTFQTCLYLAYSYMGNEISYPLKPFMIDSNRDVFWDTSLGIINRMSDKMLLLNSDPHFFTEVFQDLKNQRDGADSNLDR
ncbi:cyclin-dependent kinase 5 activator 1-like [Diretmus argenteus]